MQVKDRTSAKRRTTAIVYIVLRVLVVAVLLRAVWLGRWDQVLYCALVLVEFMIPSFIEKRLRIELTSTLEIIILLFIFAGEILGEIGELFNKIQMWDVILHTISGFLMAAIGVALIDVFNKSPRINFSLSPFFVAFVAFCFSITIGVLWEFVEFSADRYVGSDMQKDSIVYSVNSWELDNGGARFPMKIDNIITTVITGSVNGKPTEITVNGYLDIGLNDTMEDLLVNLVGALAFSIIAAFYIKDHGDGKAHVANAFIPRMLTQEELEEQTAKKAEEREKRHPHIKT